MFVGVAETKTKTKQTKQNARAVANVAGQPERELNGEEERVAVLKVHESIGRLLLTIASQDVDLDPDDQRIRDNHGRDEDLEVEARDQRLQMAVGYSDQRFCGLCSSQR